MAIEKIGMISVPQVGGITGAKGGAGAANAGKRHRSAREYSPASHRLGARARRTADPLPYERRD